MMKSQKENPMKKLKIAIFEPYIEGIGGAQRVIARYANYLQSKGHHVEIFTQRYTPQTAYRGFEKIKINIIKPTAKNLSFIAFLKKFDGFDIRIINDFPSNLVSIRNKNTAWVCYSPKRYFYDLKEHYFKNASFKGKILLYLKSFLKRIDLLSAKKTTCILPISKTIQKRVEKYYKIKDSQQVYVGIDFDKYKQGKFQNYLLCISRFETSKRIDVVIKSMEFVKNKKLKLYVIGSGSEEQKLRELAKEYPSVKILGEVSDIKLLELYTNCLAVIYIPIDEDFGLIPLEAGAAGKPFIGANEGGLKETVINDQSGFLLDTPTPENIAKKINFLDSERNIAKKMGREARKQVRKFDWDILLPQWEKLILKCAKK
jgi:glycosyltransferase involved in cell wall biosynthesis